MYQTQTTRHNHCHALRHDVYDGPVPAGEHSNAAAGATQEAQGRGGGKRGEFCMIHACARVRVQSGFQRVASLCLALSIPCNLFQIKETTFVAKNGDIMYHVSLGCNAQRPAANVRGTLTPRTTLHITHSSKGPLIARSK